MSQSSRHVLRAVGIALLPAAMTAPLPAHAQSYETDVEYYALLNLLGSATPTGAGVPVLHIEASLVGTTDPTYPVYAPDTTDPSFAGKSFTFPGTPSTSASAHATSVGQIFYGLGEMGYGISRIAAYEADGWIGTVDVATAAAPVNASRISNNSWVGSTGSTANDGTVLRLVDRLTYLYDMVQVAAMPYSAGNPLLAGAYNVIAVGETGVTNFTGSDAIDALYMPGRSRPDLVVPESYTSTAAPVVGAAAALLVQAAHAGASRLSTGSATISGIGTVYDAERAATIRAALMAGASRATNNASTTTDILNYRSTGNQSANGLDGRYGAGQLDVLASYQIIEAGEQHGAAGGASGGAIAAQGFDYVTAFGGASGSPTLETYRFTATSNAQLTATLAWKVGVSNNANLTTTFHHLNLQLFDASTQRTVASSASTVDSTQNVWAALVPGHSYELRVSSGETGSFSWSYALAWNTTALPQVTASATTIQAGQQSVLSVTPAGTGPFTYQWYQGTSGDTSTPVAGATGSTYTTAALGSTSGFWVQVTGPNGAVNSPTITITVIAASPGTAATDAPIPAWALGLLGLGLAGAATRRRRLPVGPDAA